MGLFPQNETGRHKLLVLEPPNRYPHSEPRHVVAPVFAGANLWVADGVWGQGLFMRVGGGPVLPTCKLVLSPAAWILKR